MSKHKKSNGIEVRTKSDEKVGYIVATPTSVDKRAEEIALINGRERNQVIDRDRQLAKKELLNDRSADEPADESGIVPSGMGAPPTSRGEQVANHLPEDDDTEERMVELGIDEAEHDTMVKAAKTRTPSEG